MLKTDRANVPLAALQDDLQLVNDRLSHTVYAVTASIESSPLSSAAIAVTLRADHPERFEMKTVSRDAATAVQALWQACAIGIFLFSFEALPAPPRERAI